MKVLPFVVPENQAKKERIKFAEKLLTEDVADRKASFATPGATFEFGIFCASDGESLGALLARDTKGKVIGGDVRQFTKPHAKIWFQEMQKWMMLC